MKVAINLGGAIFMHFLACTSATKTALVTTAAAALLVPVGSSAGRAATADRDVPRVDDGYAVTTGLGDYNADGRADVMARVASSGELVVRPGKGTIASGNFSQEVSVVANASNYSWFGDADIDQDGLSDLVFVVGDELRVRINKGLNGTSTFASARVIATGWSVYNMVAVTDANGDGKDDVVGRRPNGTVYASPNQTPPGGTPALGSPYAYLGNMDTVSTFLFGDVTSDSVPDLVFRLTSDGHLYTQDFYADQRSDGSYVAKTYQVRKSWNANNFTLLGDVDGDGHTDLVFRRSTGEIVVARHLGEWRPARPTTVFPSSSQIEVGTGWGRFNWLT